MKLQTLPMLLSIAILLAGCGGKSGSSGSSLVPLADKPITTQSASVVTTNAAVPISFAQFIPCANGGSGEVVVLSGNLHVLTHVAITANNIHLMFSDNPQGVAGIGSVSGDKYQATGVTREDENIANAGFPANLTFVDNFRIIGQESGNNLLVHETVHITITANGTVTVGRVNLSIACH